MSKFVKGQSGNPAGRPVLPVDVRKLMAADSAEFQRAISRIFKLPLAELKAMVKNQTGSVMELAIATTASKAITQGDHQRLRFLTERFAGKMPDRVAFEGELPGAAGADASQQLTHALLFKAIQDINKANGGGDGW